MAGVPTEDKLVQVIRFGTIEVCIALFENVDAKGRRAFAKTALKQMKLISAQYLNFDGKQELAASGQHGAHQQLHLAASVVLLVGTLSEAKQIKRWMIPDGAILLFLFRTLAPSWIDDWVGWVLDDSPFFVWGYSASGSGRFMRHSCQRRIRSWNDCLSPTLAQRS